MDKKENFWQAFLYLYWILGLGAFVGIIVLASDTVIKCCNEPEHKLYAQTGTITAIDRQNDSVNFTDRAGNTWMFAGAADWKIGDELAAVMDDNGTASILDDIIVSVHYEAKGE